MDSSGAGSGRPIRGRSAVVSLAVLAALTPSPSWAWTRSWSASPASLTGPDVAGTTVRQFVRLSAGGRRLRIRFTNEMGTDTVTLSDVRLALPGGAPGSIDASTSRHVSFNGSPSGRIAPGAPLLSDPIDIALMPLTTVAVSMYVAGQHGPSAVHPLGQSMAYVAPGSQSDAAVLRASAVSGQRILLGGIEVDDRGVLDRSVGVIGDSITDGAHSTVDADRRWPDRLAERLASRTRSGELAVFNAGIGGNHVLDGAVHDTSGPNALARLDRDILSADGVRYLIVLEGTNDLGVPVRPAQVVDDLISAYLQIIARAHARGIKVIGATLLPFTGALGNYGSSAHDMLRRSVNQWIRTAGAYDAVIDFDAVMRDPADPSRLNPVYDSGDHLHPNDAGYRAMGDAVDLGLFTP